MTNEINYFYSNSSVAADGTSIDIKDVSNITKDKTLIMSFEKILFKEKDGTPVEAINSCQRCRKLKKKCTKHKPKCLNCFKTNYECTYVEKNKNGRVTTTTSGDKYFNNLASNTSIISDGSTAAVAANSARNKFKPTMSNGRSMVEAADAVAGPGVPDTSFSAFYSQNSFASSSPKLNDKAQRTQKQIQQQVQQQMQQVQQQVNQQAYQKQVHQQPQMKPFVPYVPFVPLKSQPQPAPSQSQMQSQIQNQIQSQIQSQIRSQMQTPGPSQDQRQSQGSRTVPKNGGYQYPYSEIVANAFPSSFAVFQHQTREQFLKDFPPDANPEMPVTIPLTAGNIESSTTMEVIDPELIS